MRKSLNQLFKIILGIGIIPACIILVCIHFAQDIESHIRRRLCLVIAKNLFALPNNVLKKTSRHAFPVVLQLLMRFKCSKFVLHRSTGTHADSSNYAANGKAI